MLSKTIQLSAGEHDNHNKQQQDKLCVSVCVVANAALVSIVPQTSSGKFSGMEKHKWNVFKLTAIGRQVPRSKSAATQNSN